MDAAVMIQGLRDKSPLALAAFSKAYSARIAGVVRKLISDPWDVEEVVQDTVWTVHRKIHMFEGDNIWPWVCRIAQNAAKMKIRKYKRIAIPVDASVVEARVEDAPFANRVGQPDELVSSAKSARRFAAALTEMNQLNQDLFSAVDLGSEGIAGAAERLGLSVPAVKSRLHRVRKTLRAAIVAG